MLRIASHKRILESEKPLVMGVINLSSDSFYRGSSIEIGKVVDVTGAMINDGAGIIDLGAISTRPGASEISVGEELDRLMPALNIVRYSFPEVFISIDTYRPAIASEAFGCDVDMINDISGGTFEEGMFDLISKTHLAYVIMHTSGRPYIMQQNPAYINVVAEVDNFFFTQLQRLQNIGVHNIVIDPGFGFGKTLEHNYQLLGAISIFGQHGYPVLAGFSRKSMINKVLGTNPANALNGTTVLNAIALLNGADILRVHDVKEAVEAVKLVDSFKKFNCSKQGEN